MLIEIKIAHLITMLVDTGITFFVLGVFAMALLKAAKTTDTATDLFISMDKIDQEEAEIKAEQELGLTEEY